MQSQLSNDVCGECTGTTQQLNHNHKALEGLCTQGVDAGAANIRRVRRYHSTGTKGMVVNSSILVTI